MMLPQTETEPVLERIPQEQLTARQTALLPIQMGGVFIPIYRFLRDPTHLEELDWKSFEKLYIWRENQTVICLSNHTLASYPLRHVSFVLYHNQQYLFKGAIYGLSDDTIAETVTFFWSIPCGTESRIDWGHTGLFGFSITNLRNEQLTRILDANPRRLWEISSGRWSAEQTVLFANRPGLLNVRWTSSPMDLSFEDHCTAFVNALEQRQSSFGSLGLTFDDPDELPLSDENLRKLLQLDQVFQRLTLFRLPPEMNQLPLSARVQTLEYLIEARCYEPSDFTSLPIVAKELILMTILDAVEYWDRLIVAFFDRLAELGHFEKLDFSLRSYLFRLEVDDDASSKVAAAVIRVIRNSPNLTHLDISGMHWIWQWNSDLQSILQALEEHPSMRTLTLKAPPWDLDSDNNETDEEDDEKEDEGRKDLAKYPGYSWLAHLLTRNRHMEVLDCDDQRITDGSCIDDLYLVNACYTGSKQLLTDDTEWQLPLLNCCCGIIWTYCANWWMVLI